MLQSSVEFDMSDKRRGLAQIKFKIVLGHWFIFRSDSSERTKFISEVSKPFFFLNLGPEPMTWKCPIANNVSWMFD